MENKIQIYVTLFDDGYDVWRPTMACVLEDGSYEILPIDNFEELEEEWEFPPGSIVRAEMRTADDGSEVLLAIENVAEKISSQLKE